MTQKEVQASEELRRKAGELNVKIDEAKGTEDLVSQLRRLGSGCIGTISATHCPLLNEAADEIERLRQKVWTKSAEEIRDWLKEEDC